MQRQLKQQAKCTKSLKHLSNFVKVESGPSPTKTKSKL